MLINVKYRDERPEDRFIKKTMTARNFGNVRVMCNYRIEFLPD